MQSADRPAVSGDLERLILPSNFKAATAADLEGKKKPPKPINEMYKV